MTQKIKNALISVSDKSDLQKILPTLDKYKINLISSGGTYKKIKKLKHKCIAVSEYTDFPEILNGRVKTLHPKIHAGILSKRNNKSHKRELIKNNFDEIDLVIVNFYPFEETLKNTNNHSKIIENIDVGGPTMVRAAAKNYNDVTVIISPKQYKVLINELNNDSPLDIGPQTWLSGRLKIWVATYIPSGSNGITQKIAQLPDNIGQLSELTTL